MNFGGGTVQPIKPVLLGSDDRGACPRQDPTLATFTMVSHTTSPWDITFCHYNAFSNLFRRPNAYKTPGPGGP